jgi:hypothetical protein
VEAIRKTHPSIATQFAPENTVVSLDDKIVGYESKVERQLDVTIRATVAQYKLLIVIECKDEARPIDVGTMGAFGGTLRDVKANIRSHDLDFGIYPGSRRNGASPRN